MISLRTVHPGDTGSAPVSPRVRGAYVRLGLLPSRSADASGAGSHPIRRGPGDGRVRAGTGRADPAAPD
jgi:hypothetical protein